MSKSRASSYRGLLRPLGLDRSPLGVLVAAACVLALLLIYRVDTVTPQRSTVASFALVPIVVAAWLLSRRLTIAITALAVALRILAIEVGGISVITGLAQIITTPVLAYIGRVAAENLSRSQASAERTALVARAARIATSSDRLNVILYGVLDEMARAGLQGGLIALLDERGELYPAAVEGGADGSLLEERLLRVSPHMRHALSEARTVLLQGLNPQRAPVAERQGRYQVGTLVAVPLRAAGKTVGILELDSPEPNRYGPDDAILLEQVALAISGAVQRAGSLQLADEQLHRRLTDLGLLLETARTLSASLDLDHILGQVVRSAAELVSHGGHAGVRGTLFKVEADSAIFVAEYDERGVRLLENRFPLSQHPGLLRAIETGKGATWDFEGAREPLASLVRRAAVVRAAYAPVRTGSQVYGVLSAASRDEREFEPDEIRLLEGIADLAGLAISNAERLGLEMSRGQQLRDHAERMQALEKTKSEFLRLASHELRGPIAILRGYVSMLAEGTLGELPEQALRVLPMLGEKVAEMNHLIDQMLETARLEDTRLHLHLRLVNLTDVLREAVAGVEARATQAACQLVTELPGGSNGAEPEKVQVLADRDRILTILVNLLDNAVKYSPGGGEVRCSLQVIEGRAVVTVSDPGLGIDSADLPRLFTRFGRIVTPENSHIPGTGLGLYLSRELARMHGGDIEVESEKGRGSTFRLSLPVAMERLQRLAGEPAAEATEAAEAG